MNILLAFKAEPDAGMLAEKEWQATAQGNSGPDVSLLRSLLGADEQAAAALLLAQRKNGTPMSLTALSMGDERALHWLRYLMALGFEEAVLLETAADLRFAPEFVARHIAEWQRQNPLELIITGCQSSEGQNGQTPFLLAEMLVWPCFTQVERFTLDAPFITLEQRTEHGVRCCRVRLPAVIACVSAVKWPCQFRECASEWLRGKQQLSVKLLLSNCQRCSVCNWQEQSNDAERR